MENPAADQLPEAHSLPDGFVDSSPEPLAPSTPTLEQEKPVIDYKEEKLVEADSRPELVLNELQSREGKNEKSESSRTFPVPLSENEDDSQTPEQGKPLSDYKEERLVEIDSRPELVVNELQSSEGKAEKSENSRSFPVPLTENDDACDGSQGLELLGKDSSSQSGCISVITELAKPVSLAEEKCQSPKKAVEAGLETQAAHVKEISATDSAVNNRKIETTEVKRKNTKRTFKSEKEFLEFTLKYQQVLAERDSAITVRDKLESLCRELQRQNKMLMDECKRVSTEGQNLRLDLSNKFHDAIKEVSIRLEGQKNECLSQLKENEMYDYGHTLTFMHKKWNLMEPKASYL